MRTFTDEEMGQLLPNAKPYSVVILKQGPNFRDDTVPAIIWEHGRRNFGLRDDGVLAVVLPVADGSDVCGIGVFAPQYGPRRAGSSSSISCIARTFGAPVIDPPGNAARSRAA